MLFKIIRDTVVVFGFSFMIISCGRHGLVLPDETGEEPISEESSSDQYTQTPIESLLPSLSLNERADVLKKYTYVDPTHVVPRKILEDAVIFYHLQKANLSNSRVLSVIDFSQSSKLRRFFIINMSTGIVWPLRVSHGRGSDKDHDGLAERFSNTPGSNASSLGLYMTAETYQGGHGLSLRLDGLSSTNSNARSRAIVIHGADYVQEMSVVQGRSWGCPAVAWENRDRLISTIKGGSLVYAAR